MTATLHTEPAAHTHDAVGPGDVDAEAVAHAVMRLVADLPGHMGRFRAARIVSGHPVLGDDGEVRDDLAAYAVDVLWSIQRVVELIDALIAGRLMVQTPGARPTLCLTRAGHRALDAIEGA